MIAKFIALSTFIWLLEAIVIPFDIVIRFLRGCVRDTFYREYFNVLLRIIMYYYNNILNVKYVYLFKLECRIFIYLNIM